MIEEAQMCMKKMEMEERITNRKSMRKMVHRIPERISQVVEHIFYILGSRIAQRPYKWMVGCCVAILLCLSGLYWFRQEKNPMKLWIPPDSDFIFDTDWLMSHFGEAVRVQTFILTGDNVLEPQALVKLNEITKEVMNTRTLDEQKISWTDVCLKVPVISTVNNVQNRVKKSINSFEDDFFDQEPGKAINETIFEPSVHIDSDLYCRIISTLPQACLLISILDIWEYDSDKIANDTTEGIIRKLNEVKVSPILGHEMNFTELLGGVTFDENGRIISAEAIRTEWIVRVNLTNVNADVFGNAAGTSDWATEDVMKWELAFIQVLEKYSRELQSERNQDQQLSIWYIAGRSFGDMTVSSTFQDIDKLAVGIVLMFLYVQLILSRFNWVEWRFCLTASGLVCVGGAFIVAIGVCSILRIPYGPVHTSLPFLLLGLGIDDLFVMMASWNQVHCYEAVRDKPLHERVGLMLGHAGSAICITSLTDVVAFIIGASTILPSLQSYCFYAAIGVFVNFLLQITLFVGFFTLDAKRIEDKRNGIFPCIVHHNYVPVILDSSKTYSWKLVNYLYTKIVLTVPGKIIIILITIAAATGGTVGVLQLEQWFEPLWFLPSESYFNDYISILNKYYSSRGFEVSVYIGDIDYPSEFSKLMSITEHLSNQTYVQNIMPWPTQFAEFVGMYYQKDLATTKLEDTEFNYYLSKFLFSKVGGKYQKNFRFERQLECGDNAPKILVASIDFHFTRFTGPHEWIPAMDGSKDLVKQAGIHGFVTVWSKFFATWVTDKLISREVIRNVTLALVCVMGTTSILIAEIQTCSWILLCVLLTLLNVCGFMFFWSLTIDLVSCIALELAIGLSVDYSAHVAHAFLNAAACEGDQDRKTRVLIAMRHIGAAVAYGAGSTLLALFMMAFSQSYVFRSFFKIFFLVILFGLWHGLFLLPVILSTIGPRSVRTQQRPHHTSEKAETAEQATMFLNNKETENRDIA